jgi:hypothetical protein
MSRPVRRRRRLRRDDPVPLRREDPREAPGRDRRGREALRGVRRPRGRRRAGLLLLSGRGREGSGSRGPRLSGVLRPQSRACPPLHRLRDRVSAPAGPPCYRSARVPHVLRRSPRRAQLGRTLGGRMPDVPRAVGAGRRDGLAEASARGGARAPAAERAWNAAPRGRQRSPIDGAPCAAEACNGRIGHRPASSSTGGHGTWPDAHEMEDVAAFVWRAPESAPGQEKDGS